MRTVLVTIAAAALLLAACGSSGDAAEAAIIEIDGGASDTGDPTDGSEGNSSSDPTETLPDGDAATRTDEDAALEFADCLRDEGVDVDDPSVNADGSVNLQSMFGDQAGRGPGAVIGDNEGAFEACGDLLDGVAFGPGGNGFDQTELQDQLVEFAQCLRDQGLDVNDPDLSNLGRGQGAAGEGGGGPEAIFGVNLQDPQYEDEVEACQDILAGFGRGGN